MKHGTTFGEAVHELRREHGWSLRGLSVRADVSPSYLRAVERGDNSPTLAVAFRITSAFGYRLDTFFSDFGVGGA